MCSSDVNKVAACRGLSSTDFNCLSGTKLKREVKFKTIKERVQLVVGVVQLKL
jgi:hypothetical protein